VKNVGIVNKHIILFRRKYGNNEFKTIPHRFGHLNFMFRIDGCHNNNAIRGILEHEKNIILNF